ncbi:MAG: hypothetical protein WDW19_03705 [Neisseriaceae bacterium]
MKNLVKVIALVATLSSASVAVAGPIDDSIGAIQNLLTGLKGSVDSINVFKTSTGEGGLSADDGSLKTGSQAISGEDSGESFQSLAQPSTQPSAQPSADLGNSLEELQKWLQGLSGGPQQAQSA